MIPIDGAWPSHGAAGAPSRYGRRSCRRLGRRRCARRIALHAERARLPGRDWALEDRPVPRGPMGPAGPVRPAGACWFQEIAVVPCGQVVPASWSTKMSVPFRALLVQQPWITPELSMGLLAPDRCACGGATRHQDQGGRRADEHRRGAWSCHGVPAFRVVLSGPVGDRSLHGIGSWFPQARVTPLGRHGRRQRARRVRPVCAAGGAGERVDRAHEVDPATERVRVPVPPSRSTVPWMRSPGSRVSRRTTGPAPHSRRLPRG